MKPEDSAPKRFVIVEDHAMVLNGTAAMIRKGYPNATIETAASAQEGLSLIKAQLPNVAIIDLSIPAANTPQSSKTAHVAIGIQLLTDLLAQFPTLNIVVQTAHAPSLVRLKPDIFVHQGGFTVVDKGLPTDDLSTKIDWAMNGVNFLPQEMRTSLEIRPEWLEVLNLAFHEGLQDKAIAERINVAQRTVRHYWRKIQGVLGVHPEEGKNIRIQTEIRAREEGLID